MRVFLYRLRRLTRFPLHGIIMRVFYLRFCIDLDIFRVFLGRGHNACISHVYLYRLRRLTCFPPYCDTMRVFFTFFCTRVSLSFKTSYAFSSVWHHNACVLLAFLHRFRRLSRFPPYGFIMREFHTLVWPIATKCVCFSRFSTLVFLYRLRHLTRFPLCCITMPVFYWRFCIDLDVFCVFIGWGHNACISHVYLYCLRHLTHFPLYGVTMHVFYWRFCIDLDIFRVFLGWGHNACISHVYLYRLRRLTRFPTTGVSMRVFFTFLCTRVSLSCKTYYAFSSVWRHNACVLLAFTRFPPHGVIMRVFNTFISIV